VVATDTCSSALTSFSIKSKANNLRIEPHPNYLIAPRKH